MVLRRTGWQWKAWWGLISRQTNWEEKGPHMLRLTSQPAGEKPGVGVCLLAGFLKLRKQNSSHPKLTKTPEASNGS